MLNTITSFFESHFSVQEAEDETHTELQLQLASAALMIELCKADNDIDEAETGKLLEVLRTRFQLTDDALGELMVMARQEAQDATSLYQFTTLMNEHFGYGEKVQTVLNLWEVAYADGRIDRYEDHMIRKVADLLHLDHVDFISSKHRAREKAEAEN